MTTGYKGHDTVGCQLIKVLKTRGCQQLISQDTDPFDVNSNTAACLPRYRTLKNYSGLSPKIPRINSLLETTKQKFSLRGRG